MSEEVPAAGYNLARLHERRGDYQSSLAVLDQLLEADPENGLFLETRAFVLFRSGEVAEARREYAVLLEELPARRRVRYNLGLLELEHGQAERAHRILEQGFPEAADDAEYRWIAAEAAHAVDDEERSQEHLEVFRGLSVDQPEELGRLAQRQAEWGYTLAALEVLEAIPETVEASADLLFLKASVYLRGTEEFEVGAQAVVDAVTAGYPADDQALQDLLESLPPGEREIIEGRLAATVPESS